MFRVISEAEKALLQQAILPIFAVKTDGHFRPVGSCWIFATTGREALAFSAAHIFDEVVRSEERHEEGAASLPDILRSAKPKAVSLQLTRLKALYRRTLNDFLFVDIQRVHRDGMTDVAVCELAFQSDAGTECSFDRKMAFHAGPIKPNTKVAAVGYAGMEKTRCDVDKEKGAAWVEHFQQLSFQHGKCREYFGTRGPRGPAGPCFEIDVCSYHGMSGGPIFHKGYGEEIVGCGVISRGTAFGGEETTVAAALWPAYSFKIDSLRGDDDQRFTLIDLARQGWIDDKSNGPAHFRFAQESDETRCGIIGWV